MKGKILVLERLSCPYHITKLFNFPIPCHSPHPTFQSSYICPCRMKIIDVIDESSQVQEHLYSWLSIGDSLNFEIKIGTILDISMRHAMNLKLAIVAYEIQPQLFSSLVHFL